MSDIFDSLYTSQDGRAFGRNYTPPPRFEFGQWYPVATYIKEPGSDGQSVTIEECRMPARFYRIRVMAGKNSVMDDQKAYTLTTGSSAESLAITIAKAIRDGMLGLEDAP